LAKSASGIHESVCKELPVDQAFKIKEIGRALLQARRNYRTAKELSKL
jgi:hypothetical protein